VHPVLSCKIKKARKLFSGFFDFNYFLFLAKILVKKKHFFILQLT